MITFKKVRYKNFLSSGNNFTEIDLCKTKSTLVVGQNGSGKSTMLDALSFALFGKAHRNINKPQLVNSVNQKHCLVEAEFIIGRSEFKIVRGIKPQKFEIWKNGELINQSSHNLEYQKILEQNILKLNHRSFHQVVVLGSSSFIPFMQLERSHRRDIIEDLLDIQVFSKMNTLLKERIGVLKDQFKDINHQVEIVDTKIETQKKYINDVKVLTEQNIANKKSSIKTDSDQIQSLQEFCNELSEDIEKEEPINQKTLEELQDKNQAYVHEDARIKSEISTLVKNAKFYEDHSDCPTCSQSISEELRKEKIQAAKDEAKDLHKLKEKLSENSVKLKADLDEAKEVALKHQGMRTVIATNLQEIKSLNKRIKDLQNEIKNNSTKDLTEAKDDLKVYDKDRDNLLEDKLKIVDQTSYNSVMFEMLKDTGIKTKIIKQYIPVINKLVNQYLQILDFFVHFNLDDSFKETIRSRHRDDFTYESFSEGEKQRIDLALLFTWRQIAKMKNSVSTNLLVLDETFDSSLDQDGVENLLKILYTLDNDTNIFIISHKGEILNDKFEHKIEFIKDKNFSKIRGLRAA